MPTAAVILAAGLGTRMKSDLAKVLHPLAGQPLVCYPVELAIALKADPIVVIVGNQAKTVETLLFERYGRRVTCALQREQLGTGHAVLCAEKALKSFKGTVLILSGDVPLLEKDTMTRLIRARGKKPLALVTAQLDDPTGYGRVIRDEKGRIVEVVEHRDASDAQRAIREANMGIYAADRDFLFKGLKAIGTNNDQGEYYLPDLVRIAHAKRLETAGIQADPLETRGVNTRVHLAELERHLRRAVNTRHMLAGVTLLDPESTFISPKATIDRDTVIGPGVELRDAVSVGAHCRIETGSILSNSRIADGVHIQPYSIIDGGEIRNDAIIGPFARIRPGSDIGMGCHIGNFVETKKSTLKDGAKANHLSYIGDAVIGCRTNVGAGTITCNYDGYAKYRTTVGDDVLIGSDTQLIAPVTVPDRVVLGAGTSLTGKVAAQPGSLIVTRSEAVVTPGYRDKLQARALTAKKKQAAEAKKKTKTAKAGKADKKKTKKS
jgi:bifunctional UDP-N-acetylglucosamine pyrophosphorylase/glucosamine-1-phosphate N-acetyltransferase